METTVVEMRHSMKNVFSEIERHENVNVLYRGRREAAMNKIRNGRTDAI